MHCGIPNRVQNDRALSNTFLLLKEKVMQNNVKKKKIHILSRFTVFLLTKK